MKRCRRCDVEKPLDDFPKRSRKHARDGRYSYCRSCSRLLARERMRKWRHTNPERAKAKAKVYNRRFRQARPTYHLEWYLRNIEDERERSRKSMRKSRTANPEAERERKRRYRLTHADVVRVRERERTYARRALQPYSPEMAALMAALVLQPCTYCGTTENITIDHVMPLSRGGKHEADNLAPACFSCNSSKSNRLLSEWERAA